MKNEIPKSEEVPTTQLGYSGTGELPKVAEPQSEGTGTEEPLYNFHWLLKGNYK